MLRNNKYIWELITGYHIIQGDIEGFKLEFLKAITKTPSYCTEIMKNAFGEDYQVSQVLSCILADMYKVAIKKLLDEKAIKEYDKFKNSNGEYSVFTTSYGRAER